MSLVASRPYVETRTPYVYRLFDADGGLLYIGSSINPRARFDRHKLEQPWWPQVASWTLEACPSLDEARIAERLAIDAEDPRHNKIRYLPVLPKNKHRMVRFSDEDWAEFGDLTTEAGSDRSAILNQFIRWYLRRPGAKLPERPERPAGQR